MRAATSELPLRPLPPGPATPTAWQLLQWVVRPGPFMEENARRFGDAFTLRLIASGRNVFVHHPDMIRDVFTGDPGIFHAGEANTIVKQVVGHSSVLLLDDAPHQRARKLLLPPFHGERMVAYGELIREITLREARRWPERTPFASLRAFQRISLEVILRAVFGVDDAQRLGALRADLEEMMAISGKPYLLLLISPDGEMRAPAVQERLGPLTPLNRFLQLRERVDALLHAEFARRRATGHFGEDILSMLMAARYDDGSPLSDGELRDQLMTLLVAGHETTATSLAWLGSELFRRPDLVARLREELHRVTGGAPIRAQDVARLEELDAVIKETARLDPILPIVVRLLKAPARVGPLELPAGTVVCPCIYLAQRRTDVWGEDAAVFRPERFRTRKALPFEWFPFGGGARRCIGMAFALFEMKVVMATLLAHYDLTLAPGYTPTRVRRGITFAPSRGAPVTATAR